MNRFANNLQTYQVNDTETHDMNIYNHGNVLPMICDWLFFPSFVALFLF